MKEPIPFYCKRCKRAFHSKTKVTKNATFCYFCGFLCRMSDPQPWRKNKFCVICHKKLIGMQRLYCGKICGMKIKVKR